MGVVAWGFNMTLKNMALIDLSYVLTPFAAWFVAGIVKFIINSIKARRWAFSLIGYGGLPSTHSAIVSSTAMLVALREGIGHPAFGVAVTLAFIVMLDAVSLRRHIGRQAESINRLCIRIETTAPAPLRERIGHTQIEILAGVLIGSGVASLIWEWLSRPSVA